jgi:Tol biopolymer transport system component
VVNREAEFLTQLRQLTFEGRRSGEGYFSADGKRMVFQSEREPGNPFYQIYMLDRETGDLQRVSPGHGKTTCAWIHPDGHHVLFASTQMDPEAQAKQKAENEQRASGKERRYSWDYDATYELMEWDQTTGQYRSLTRVDGYDAEGSYSPDGQWIAFASNRRAYSGALTPSEKALFEHDPASATDLYLMRRDGSELKRLTDTVGYDGGPFFSPDGRRICWRRFREDGAAAEIYTMAIDGSDVRCLTSMGAVSWAPMYHPSGDYLIFGSNPEGFGNFELYVVDAQGKSQPQRVTFTDGFDSLPSFTPDGTEIAWTSNRTANKQSQIFIAKWNDAAARKSLGLEASKVSSLHSDLASDDRREAQQSAAASMADFQAADIGRHVDFLCRPELGGRLTGSEGELRATAYVAAFLESQGLQGAGADGNWFEPFPFTAGVDLGSDNQLTWGDISYRVNEDWRPLAFSKSTQIPATSIAFAGYGIVAPKENGQAEYDSYVHLDVEGKWVLVLRHYPSDVDAERKQHLSRFASLRYKAMAARDRGAVGLIVVSGPSSGVRNQLVPLQLDGALAGSSLAVISVTDSVAKGWFEGTEDSLETLQTELDRGEMMMGFDLPKAKLTARTDVKQIRKSGRNVLGWLRSGNPHASGMVIVGAHIDHLGSGQSGSSLAKEEEKGGVHRGADDNASGVAGMMEIAQYLAHQQRTGKLVLKHDVLFAAWSGEELGLIGSGHFADEFFKLYPNRLAHDPPSSAPGALQPVEPITSPEPPKAGSLYPGVVAALNLDMIGRLRDNVVLQGVGSSTAWPQEIEKRNAVVGLSVKLQNDSYLPTDASTFFMKGVPILSAFTGNHAEYHTPRDTPDLINYDGAAKIAQLMGLIARSLASSDSVPDYVSQKAPENQGVRASLIVYLGSIPDYSAGDIQGVRLSGVNPTGPAAKAGVLAGDIVVELAGRKVENIYDYTFAIDTLKVNQETDVVVKRGKEVLRLKVTPTSRQ